MNGGEESTDSRPLEELDVGELVAAHAAEEHDVLLDGNKQIHL